MIPFIKLMLRQGQNVSCPIHAPNLIKRLGLLASLVFESMDKIICKYHVYKGFLSRDGYPAICLILRIPKVINTGLGLEAYY